MFLKKDRHEGEERLPNIAIRRFLNITLITGGLLDEVPYTGSSLKARFDWVRGPTPGWPAQVKNR